MTFLSITPDQFDTAINVRPTTRTARRGASVLGQAAAALVVMGVLTIPGAVAQAKWSKLNLIVTIVQHRALATFSA